MSALEQFRREWSERFPCDSAPQLTCLLTRRSQSVSLASRRFDTGIRSAMVTVGNGGPPGDVQSAITAWELSIGRTPEAQPAQSPGPSSPPLSPLTAGTFFTRQRRLRSETGSCFPTTLTDRQQSLPATTAVSATAPLPVCREAVERTLRTFKSNVERLERELEQNRFVVDFLKRTLRPTPDGRPTRPEYSRDPGAVELRQRGSSSLSKNNAEHRLSRSTPQLLLTPASPSATQVSSSSPSSPRPVEPTTPVPPVRQRRRAARDRAASSLSLSPSPSAFSAGRNSCWRTEAYEEVVSCVVDDNDDFSGPRQLQKRQLQQQQQQRPTQPQSGRRASEHAIKAAVREPTTPVASPASVVRPVVVSVASTPPPTSKTALKETPSSLSSSSFLSSASTASSEESASTTSSSTGSTGSYNIDQVPAVVAVGPSNPDAVMREDRGRVCPSRAWCMPELTSALDFLEYNRRSHGEPDEGSGKRRFSVVPRPGTDKSSSSSSSSSATVVATTSATSSTTEKTNNEMTATSRGSSNDTNKRASISPTSKSSATLPILTKC